MLIEVEGSSESKWGKQSSIVGFLEIISVQWTQI